jgi:hypothetical protein
LIEIISHRGLWRKPFERNSLASLRSSIDEGFGLETDVRDLNGDLVISHDMPTDSDENVTLDELLTIYCSSSCNLTLALNVKSDGLSSSIKEQLQKYKIENYFVFDMSVPDTLSYKNEGLNYFTRQSEYETEPVLYHEACGVWLDEFLSPWITKDIIRRHHQSGKRVAIVSPELHGRTYENEWEKYKSITSHNPELNILLCTDYPLQARSYFEQ